MPFFHFFLVLGRRCQLLSFSLFMPLKDLCTRSTYERTKERLFLFPVSYVKLLPTYKLKVLLCSTSLQVKHIFNNNFLTYYEEYIGTRIREQCNAR